MIIHCVKGIFMSYHRPDYSVHHTVSRYQMILNHSLMHSTLLQTLKPSSLFREYLHGKIHAPYVYCKTPLLVAIALCQHLK